MASDARHYAEGPEPLIVSLARRGDRAAFSELVRRRQTWLRNLMRRFCNEPSLADDLAQQAFLNAYRKIGQLRNVEKFAAWLKRIAITEWIHYQRRQPDGLHVTHDEPPDVSRTDSTSTGMDLDGALATLPASMRVCVVLSYHERLSHKEIAELTGFKLGTVKTNVRRGAARLRELLSAYGENQ